MYADNQCHPWTWAYSKEWSWPGNIGIVGKNSPGGAGLARESLIFMS